jgi:hypothetical protein
MAAASKEMPMTHGILPAAGLASRMRVLPKFLLPHSADYETLIEKHIRQMSKVCEKIWIPTRPEQVPLLSSLGISSEKVAILPMITNSMTETVLRTSEIAGGGAGQKFLLTMPDTFFAGEQPFDFLFSAENKMNLACWEIRPDQIGKLGQVDLCELPLGEVLDARDKDPDCTYRHAWGAMSFERSALEFFRAEMPHPGYALPLMIGARVPIVAKVMEGTYYDCGTPMEYIRMLRAEIGEPLT